MEKGKTAVLVFEAIGVVCFGVSFVLRDHYGLGIGAVSLKMRNP